MSIRQIGARAGFAALLTGPACVPPELVDRHADRVEAFSPAPFTPEGAPWSDPARALGPPDGRTLAVGAGAVVILRFFRPLTDGNGPDLRVYEVGPDGAEARVAVSRNGEAWIELAEPVRGRVTNLELGGLDALPARLVRLRGLDLAGPEPGFDLDALEALH